MKKRFLTKKINIVESDRKPEGLKTAEAAQKESKKFNDDYLKNITTKLSDIYDFDKGEENALEEPPKVDREDDLDGYDIEAKGAGKMQGIRYDNEGTDVHDDFEKRIDDLNDTSEYDKEFGTVDGFGEGDKDNVYDELKKAGEEYKDYKYGKEKYKEAEDEYIETPKVRTTVKEGKMKRLNFKQEFGTEEEILSLIPENYKFDGHVFLMTDGNQTVKVRWDEAINEGSILVYQNREKINEDMERMKKLFNYKHSDTVSKTNNYINETVEFNNIMDIVRKK
jgi:hypothetical protein